MKKLFLLKSICFIFFMLLISNTLWAQNMTPTKTRCGKNQIKKTTASPKRNYKKIELPPDYKPPVADKNSYTFRETFASKKQLKRINKKRKRKVQGCMATNF